MELDEADELLSQMEIELQGMPQSIKPPYASRAKSAKSALQSAKSRAREQHAVLARSTLLSDVGGSPFRDSTDTEEGGISGDRARLLRGTSLLESGSKRLQDAQRVALETEEQGADILRDLRRQREQIENSRETVWVLNISIVNVLLLNLSLNVLSLFLLINQLRTADSAIDRATGTLKKMIRRYVKNTPHSTLSFLLCTYP